MTADEGRAAEKAQNPTEFFESIGDRVESLAPATEGADGGDDDDDHRPVDEIESLCMNCGNNVRLRSWGDDKRMKRPAQRVLADTFVLDRA
jgi:hypothetical protein